MPRLASTRGGYPAGPLAHGGSLDGARALFPAAPEPWLDLSTGINPVPYPLPALPAEAFTRLPEPAAMARLQQAAAAAYGVDDPAMVVAAPGTQILIGLLPWLFPQPRVAVLGPTYAEHAASWRAAGAAVVQVSNLSEVGDASAVVLCSPNNPDGREVSEAEIRAVSDRLAAQGGLVVVDAAFADFRDGAAATPPPTPPSRGGGLDRLPLPLREGAGGGVATAPHPPALQHPPRITLRSFGKAYGLAGLRLGFAVAAPARAAIIRAALGPWALSGPALAIGTQALADTAWRQAAALRLHRDAAALDAVLTRAGLRVVGGTCLFRLVATSQADALFHQLGRAGILVRRFADQPNRLRFGLPATAAELARLAQALAIPTPAPRR